MINIIKNKQQTLIQFMMAELQAHMTNNKQKAPT